ncbi:MAG TPA: hypothetical protein DER15_02305 [Clostridiales bacterium]|jgi:hypothetical protein|nr:hypothetical protein [Clostridiales bacterium]
MDKINEIIKIYDKMYIKQIKKILKVLEEQDNMVNSCKNNLYASGELLISIMKMIETNHVNVALPCLRNVYEMLLKAIILEDNQDMMESYNKIIKDIEKDRMSEVRKYVSKNFNKYFSIIEKDEIFENTLGEGILTYIYKCLCRYSHATKVSEFVYLIEKEDDLKGLFNLYLSLFLVYQIVLLYIDAVCTKLNLEKLNNEIFLVSGIIFLNTINVLTILKSKIEDIKEYSKKILGEPDDLFKIRIEEEKELSTFFIEGIKTEIESINVQKEIVDNYCKIFFKKYFTQKQLEKIDKIIKSIKKGERT